MLFKNILISLCVIFNFLLIHNLYAEELPNHKNIDLLLSACENFDNEEECLISDCMWDPNRGCYDLNSNNDGRIEPLDPKKNTKGPDARKQEGLTILNINGRKTSISLNFFCTAFS